MYAGDELYDDDCTSGLLPEDRYPFSDDEDAPYPITPAVDRILTEAYARIDHSPEGQRWAAAHLAELEDLDFIAARIDEQNSPLALDTMARRTAPPHNPR
jgi:hypothetical protein